MDVVVKQVIKFLEEKQLNPIDVCEAFLKDIIPKSKKPWIFFQIFIENWEKVGKDNVPSVLLSQDEEELVKNKYKLLLLEIVRAIYRETKESNLFYKKLYEVVFKSGIFPTDKKTTAVLLKMMTKEISILPYYKVDNLLLMSDVEFNNAMQKIRPQLRKAEGAFLRGFGSRTELVSQLYTIASEINDRDLEIVFWSVMYYYASVGRK